MSLATPRTIAQQVPLSEEFSRQDYWSGCQALLQGNLPGPGIKPTSLMSPELAGRFFTTSTSWDSFLGGPRKVQWSYFKVSIHQLRGLFISHQSPQRVHQATYYVLQLCWTFIKICIAFWLRAHACYAVWLCRVKFQVGHLQASW